MTTKVHWAPACLLPHPATVTSHRLMQRALVQERLTNNAQSHPHLIHHHSIGIEYGDA